MNCIICKKGSTSQGATTITLTRNQSTVVIKNVPAQICDNCGEEYVNESTSSQLLRDASQALQAGTLVDVRNYIAA